MAKVIQEIAVEVILPNYFSHILAKQHDCDSRFLKVTFVNGRERIPIEQGSNVTINTWRMDGESRCFAGEVNADGTITVPLDAWALELAGDLYCDITVTSGDCKLTCTTFHVDVEPVSNI